MNLTPKQLRILQFIRDWRHHNGYSPTMQEIADQLGVSKVTIFEHVESLIAKGTLIRNPNKARSLSIPDDVVVPGEVGGRVGLASASSQGIESGRRAGGHAALSSLQFPLVGKIAAGYPIEKFAQDDVLSLEEIFGPRKGQRGNLFALQVDGDSMKDEGIFDGDYVIVERRDTARNGERVVALLPNGETTLKTLFREKDGTIRLQPANPEFAPIIVREISIQGVVIGVLRRY
ncbi:MAG: transcriptional repressor LexA [Phycisphaerae bacterium]|nr:transcriptional repressor LexA [Phycisphaerae bacterium]